MHIVFQAALQVGFFIHLGDAATVLLDSSVSFFSCFFMKSQTDSMMAIRSPCGRSLFHCENTSWLIRVCSSVITTCNEARKISTLCTDKSKSSIIVTDFFNISIPDFLYLDISSLVPWQVTHKQSRTDW